ncbi:glycosyltransferase [uncultured Jatrophihabitans sp.]|uniref:glycosyltransferase n=1 Tax=uncultured Jatrophihabitans sp. TaxID=1610747 RepID=UPI0035CC7D3D
MTSGQSAPADPSTAVIVVNYGAHRLLQNNIVPLGPDVRVVVVDNWFSAAERAAAAGLADEHGWEFVASPGNPGFGAAVNAGAARAKALGCRTLLLVNPDARVGLDVTAALVEHVRANPDDLVCPRIVDSDGTVVFRGSEIVLRTGALRAARASKQARVGTDGPVRPWLTGACLAVSMQQFERVGGFAEDYFLYWEDVEFSYRAAAGGARLVVRDDLVVRHDEGGTHAVRAQVRGPAKSTLYYRWNTRNRLLFAARNMPTQALLGWLVHTPAQSWQILLRGGRRQLVHSPRPMSAALYGSLAGAALAVRELGRRAVSGARGQVQPDVTRYRPAVPAGPVIFYSADLDVDDWSSRHAGGEVPDRWPYGLDHLAGSTVAPPRREHEWQLHERVLRKLDGRYDWRVRAPRDAPALCWDERTGVPVALTRRSAFTASGVIWLTDRRPRGTADRLTRRALQRCDALWVLSAAQRDELARAWAVPAERIHHVLMGIDEQFWTPAPEGERAGSDTVLVVGNDRDRDHATAVRAVVLAQRSRPGLRLELVTRLPIDVAPGVGERVAELPHAALLHRYRAAGVVALALRPNLHCSGVTALLEAMACARPVVVSATPGMTDYVRDGSTGILVPPGDDRAMADAVLELAADRDAADALGRAARADVLERFTSSRMAARIAALVDGA